MNRHFVARRLLQVVPTILGIVLIGFLLIHLAPGDPLLALAGEHGDPAYYAFMRARFGLDLPLPQQLGTFLVRVVQGDLGTSYVQGRSTLSIILERVPATLLLTGSALVIATASGITLALFAARSPNGVTDVSVNTLALGLYSAPTFWIAQVALLIVALHLGLTPVQGMQQAGSTATGWSRGMDIARHLVLPAFVLAAQEVAALVRLTRSGLVEELARDHIRTARAKGASEFTLLVRHALPRALLPTISVIGARAGHLLAGAAIVEVIFGWPGTGRLLFDSLQSRDAPVLLGLFMVTSAAVVLVNLMTDLAHAYLDPRISFR